jgi:hypothetical protein
MKVAIDVVAVAAVPRYALRIRADVAAATWRSMPTNHNLPLPPPPPHATRWPRHECDISILLPLLATQ